MRCASLKSLSTITPHGKRVREVWCKLTRTQLIDEFPAVAAYVSACYSPPGTRILRRMAVDIVLETYGVEFLGVHRRTATAIHYANAGDTYIATALFCGNTLRVGCWGDLIDNGAIKS